MRRAPALESPSTGPTGKAAYIGVGPRIVGKNRIAGPNQGRLSARVAQFRTHPNGTSWRPFSRYVRWHRAPTRRSGTEPRVKHSNLLLPPWPLRVRESDFHRLEGSAQRLAKDRSVRPLRVRAFGRARSGSLVSRTIAATRDEVDSVDVVLLPESAVDESEVNDLEALLDRTWTAME